MTELNIPEGLRYTAEHEWIERTGDTTVRVGITDFAQQQLGDVVFVQLPGEGDAVTAGESLGEVESTKSVSDIFAPLSGSVGSANAALTDTPELVNTDPYGAGWLVVLEVKDADALDSALGETLDAAGYRAIAEG
ncbi:glycine cleavage system protein GcvH [Rhodococcus sp. D2-41]|uniref:glycine cleavage system protein GcvH n=1 Tax=Speluncibacter jeojiensis TaxID=2710754 RepID=UPI0024101B13|nr:glycine cleavage system protein GcvH [Rhodococcus sp. D2-41]MDG3012855.1 glycine cleavage system protein GcvH [Rhodococcus sp. D2-41]